MKPVAIAESMLLKTRSIYSKSKIPGWIEFLNENNIPFEVIDCYKSNVVEMFRNYSALLWHYSNFVISDLMEAQNILNVASQMGLKVFPDYNTGWHFDDKIAQMYALQSIGASIPMSWVFYELDKCIAWLKEEATYPIVAKLRCGSGSNNVKLISNYSEGFHYAKRMFSRGYQAAPSLIYKTFSKIQSTYDLKTFIQRFRRIPDFLHARKFAQSMPIEKGYCYFQEFIPNEGFDIKVVIVGDKLSFFCRSVRKRDFRASGGGAFYYDKSSISDQIINSAFDVSSNLKLQQIGFDYVVDTRTGVGKIIEMCFGFDQDAIYDCGGYWDKSLVWHNKPLNVTIETIKNLLRQ